MTHARAPESTVEVVTLRLVPPTQPPSAHSPMRLDRLSRLLVLPAASLGVLLACNSPFEPRRARQPDEQPAMLSVNVFFADSASAVAYPLDPPRAGATAMRSGVTVRAYLTTGVDRDGDVRRVVSDTLQLLDTTLTAATAASTAGAGATGAASTAPQYATPTYAAFIPRAERDFASRPVVVTRAPTISGLTPRPTPPAAYAVGRAGPDTITVRGGGDLLLALVLPSDSASRPGPLDPAQWSVLVQGDVGAPVVVTGPGLPPAVVRVPAELLPTSARGELVARLYAQRFVPSAVESLAFDPRAYRVALRVESRLAWRVRLAR